MEITINNASLKENIQRYFIEKIALNINVQHEKYNLNSSLLEIGLDSISLVKIAEDLEKEIGIELYPTVFFEYQTIGAVTDYFEEEFYSDFTVFFKKEQSNTTVEETVPSSDYKEDQRSLFHKIKDYFYGKIAANIELSTTNFLLESSLLDLGLDSISLVKIAEELEQEVGIELYPTVFFEYQTLGEILAYFERDFCTQFESYFLQNNTKEQSVKVAKNVENENNSNDTSKVAKNLENVNSSNDTTEEKIKDFFLKVLSQFINVEASSFKLDSSLLDVGLDSISLVKIAEDLEQKIGIELYPTVFFEYQTIEAVLGYFNSEFSEKFKVFFTTTNFSVSPSLTEERIIPPTVTEEVTDLNQTIEKYFHEILSRQLNSSKYDFKKESSLLDLGLDSISLVKIAEEIENEIGIELNPTLFFEYQTLEAFIGYLKREFNREFNTFFNQKEPLITPKEVNELSEDRIKTADIENNVSVNDIAIIGIDCEFPQSENAQIFWENLVAEKDLISNTPEDRLLDWHSFFESLDTDRISKTDLDFQAGYLKDIDKFDNEFFNLSPSEAESLDPQQRLFLQSSVKCIANAGYSLKSFENTNTGVFGAVSTRDYHELAILKRCEIKPHSATGLALNMVANRVSYFLNLNGPSEVIDTACSSSLVALNRAVSAINNNECDQAIVGGVNICVTPTIFLSFKATGILSDTSRCKVFDKNANGYVRGEGIATVLVKSLKSAIADKDHIYAVIKGSAVNHSGRGQSITSPSSRRQSEVIKKALEVASIPLNSISYFEAHGTGTALGDPVEIEGIKSVFSSVSSDKDFNCDIGSVKSNIGHLEAAAGMASLIKVILSFKNKFLPKSLHINEMNPYIKIKDTGLSILTQSKKWENNKYPLRAGISSFGFGGTNSHVILEDYEDKSKASKYADELILFFSAPSQDQLDTYLRAINNDLNKNYYKLADVAFTLEKGRDIYDYQASFKVSDVNGLKKKIEQYLETKNSDVLLVQDEINNWILKGGTLNNREYYKDSKRVPLPIFNFKKKRFWLESNIDKIRATQISDNAESNGQIDLISEFITDLVAGYLSIEKEKININQSFNQYGLDSILGMKVLNQLEQKYNIPLYINELITNDTISKLSHLVQNEATKQTEKTPQISSIPQSNNNPIDDYIIDLVVGYLSIEKEKININQSFNQYGLDSILGMKLLNQLEQKYNIPLYINELITNDTISKLSHLIQNEVTKQIN